MCVFVCVFQEHLSHIGPEEFVQAFVQKDPLDGTQVNLCLSQINTCRSVLRLESYNLFLVKSNNMTGKAKCFLGSNHSTFPISIFFERLSQ